MAIAALPTLLPPFVFPTAYFAAALPNLTQQFYSSSVSGDILVRRMATTRKRQQKNGSPQRIQYM
jgi:hypothetical protein